VTFVPKTLGDANFFKDVRQSMANTGEWAFAGMDGDLKYVVMDSLFFSMITILRPDGKYFTTEYPNAMSFSQYAKILTGNQSNSIPRVRVAVNGTFYDNSNYHWTGPDEARGWVGEVIQAGVLIKPPPVLPGAGYMGSNYFIGRNGQRTGRYHYGASLPSQYGDPLNPSSKLTYAMGGLLRLIINKAIPPDLKLTAGLLVGKTIVGYHQASECLFVVCQEDADYSGTELLAIANGLKKAGADVALQCDGSSSSSLVVDGVEQVSCLFLKDNTTPNGLGFRFGDLTLGGPDSSLNAPGVPANTPNFSGSIRASAATVNPVTTGKLTLTINSFGSSLGHNAANIATGLALPANTAVPGYPLKLEASAPGIDLLAGVIFNSVGVPQKTVQCQAKLHQQADMDAIVGTVKVIQGANTITTGIFSWPILV
jgi:hypothetical protein